MPDSIKKVLLGALAGALLVGFAWHAMSERAKRASRMVEAAGVESTNGPSPESATVHGFCCYFLKRQPLPPPD